MQTYLNLLQKVLEKGTPKTDRTGTGTLSLFAEHLDFDLTHFPLLTTKKVHFKSIVIELLWFLKGETNIRFLKENKVSIWDEWADEEGELGPVYGKQWRNWNGIDQIAEVIMDLKNNPHSRRHIVSSWNVSDIPFMALPPCHCLFQFYVSDGALSCQLYQRSADLFLGVPFNIASYALLTEMVAQVCGFKAERLHIAFGDVHLYQNHLEQAKTQLQRTPLPLPTLRLNTAVSNIFDFKEGDIQLENYVSHPKIEAPVAV